MVLVGMVAQQVGKVVLGQREEAFVLPERVVGIEADGREC